MYRSVLLIPRIARSALGHAYRSRKSRKMPFRANLCAWVISRTSVGARAPRGKRCLESGYVLLCPFCCAHQSLVEQMSHSLQGEGDAARNEGSPPGHPGGLIGSNTYLRGTVTAVRLLAGGPSLAQISPAFGHKANAERGNAPTSSSDASEASRC